MLTTPIAPQCLELIARRVAKIFKSARGIEHLKLSFDRLSEVFAETPGGSTTCYRSSILATESNDHAYECACLYGLRQP